ncbi:hypothetical protein RIF29_37479 [Crotalaria pallida]|uniref:Aluminum activated malate transporter n=1 Tax=Crotalaria pallida TaxID=3830 RepID=A0AAN9HWC3_CROPI
MNGKEGNVIQINIPTTTTTNKPETASTISCNKTWLQSVWDFCKEDRNRVVFPLKVGLAVLLVSSLILFQAPYKVFGANIIWAILTAVLVFEYTVGATFDRGFNRALGSLLAGILAIAVAQTALSSGHVAEPFLIGISIFLIAAMTTFVKMWPSLVKYEYGFRVMLLSYCLIVVSGYRMGNPIRTMIDRLYSIAIGGIISVLVNVCVCPIWAGEQLHKELVQNFNSVADSLEECAKKYLDDGPKQSKFTADDSIDEFPNEPAYKRCQSTLNSGPKLKTLADSAKWEPPHGRFLHFLYPWSEYVKVDSVLRHCAYEVMALHSILHSEIQAPFNLRIAFQPEILEASNQAAELVRLLGRDISSMKWSLKNSHIKRVHSSIDRLQRSMHIHSYLLTATFESHVPDNPTKQPLPTEQTEPPYHDITKKQLRRLYSWPSREVDAYEEDSGNITPELFPRMKALESTATLSLANFTSSLVEFVARLDHLIEAVDKLSEMAKFKHDELTL